MMKRNDIKKRCIRQIAWLICLAVFSGCTKPAVVDLSLTGQYAQVVGSEYDVISEVDAYGIYEDLDRKVIAYIELIPGVGISGPEVAFKKRIAKGQKIKVLSAWRERKLLYSDVYYVVALQDEGLPRDIQVRIGLSRGNEGGGAELNPHVYERIRKEVKGDGSI
jgi:hypothetical protein